MYGYEAPDRMEAVKITLKLDKSAYERHRTRCGRWDHPDTVAEGDTVMVTYDFSAHYYGDVVEKLEASTTSPATPTSFARPRSRS